MKLEPWLGSHVDHWFPPLPVHAFISRHGVFWKKPTLRRARSPPPQRPKLCSTYWRT